MYHLMYFTIIPEEEQGVGGIISDKDEFPKNYSVVEKASTDNFDITLLDVANNCMQIEPSARPSAQVVYEASVGFLDSSAFFRAKRSRVA